MDELTQLLLSIERDERVDTQRLLPLVYEQLRAMARQELDREKPGQTLQATALVHEAYLRLISNGNPGAWAGRAHFFAAAAEAMRRILVENARRKLGPKRGGSLRRADVELDRLAVDLPGVDVLALDESLTRLAAESPARAELVKLRFFAGLTNAEAAEALGISVATAERYWTFAKAWLYADLGEEGG
jgi:RNA polymerase sigma factor (TIGR02999 family)